METTHESIFEKIARNFGKKRPTPTRDKTLNTNYRTNKGSNNPKFNTMSKKRRQKAKFDAKGRKINQMVARRKRK